MKNFLIGFLLAALIFGPPTEAQYSATTGRMWPRVVSVAFSATPTFDGAQGTAFVITLTGNVTSSSLSNMVEGATYTFHICQDGIGGRTFAWPAAVIGEVAIGAVLSTCTVQQVTVRGGNAYATAAGLIGL